MKSDFIRLDTAIIPSSDVEKKAIELSRFFSDQGETFFTLDKKDYLPHITLYSVEYPTENLQKIFNVLKDFASSHKNFDIDLPELVMDDSEGFPGIEIRVKKTKQLDDFHREVIDVLNPLREGHLREKYKNPEYVKKFPAKSRKLMSEILQKTGYARVLEVYKPHISIAAFSAEMKSGEVKMSSYEATKMNVNRIGLFTMGEWGTCNKLLKEFLIGD